MLNKERDEFLGIQDTLKALADPIRNNITLLCFGEAFRFVVMIVILTLNAVQKPPRKSFPQSCLI